MEWLLGQVSDPNIGLPFIINYTPQQYGAGIQNWDIAQDMDGIMYWGNNFGLLAFDGGGWRIHPIKNGAKVRSVSIGANGKIYVGGQGDFGYFYPDNLGNLTYTSLADSLPEAYRNFDETWSVYANRESVYFCTFDNIFIYHKDGWKILTPEHDLGLSFYVKDKLYVQEWKKGIVSPEGAVLKKIKGTELFGEQKISAIIPLRKEEMLIMIQKGNIYHFDGSRLTPWQVAGITDRNQSLINTAIRLRDGNIAVGTQSDGLIIISPKGDVLLRLNKGQGLQSRTVLSLYQDVHDNLWAGLNNGISYIELNAPITLINEQVLPGTGYAAYLDQDRIYLGTNNGVYYKYLSRPLSKFEIVPGTAGQVYHLTKIDGELLLGHNQGAFALSQKTKRISKNPGVWTFLPLKNNPGYLVAGHYNGMSVYELREGKWVYKNEIKGFRESSRVIEQDEEGVIWMTHGYKGVYKIVLNAGLDGIKEAILYDSRHGFPSDVLINVFKLKNRLVFPAERGIYRYDAAKDLFVEDQYFTDLFGSDANIRILKEDTYGNIYFVSENNLGVVKANASGQYQIRQFNKTNGMLNDDLPNITILDHQNVIIGAKEGFIHYNPSILKRNDYPFKVLIRRVETVSNGNSLIYGGNGSADSVVSIPELSYEDNAIRFTFSSTFYENPSDIEYQYFLEHFEDGWSEWTHSNVKEYTNIPEGDYIFQVRSRNIYGTQSENTASCHISVAPPWHRTPGAYFLYAFGGLAIILMISLRVRKKYKNELAQKSSELEDYVKKSEMQIAELRNRQLQAEIKHKNKELATSALHLMNKNHFLSLLKQSLKNLLSSQAESGSNAEIKNILKEIDQNIAHDDDWQQFEFHFDQVHGDFSNRLKTSYPALSPQERKLSAYLRMNMSTKEIASLLNISVRGVEIGRYRLRKKLGLKREDNLAEFILNF